MIDSPWQEAIDVELGFVVISLLVVLVAIGHSSPGRSSNGFVSLDSIFIFLHFTYLSIGSRGMQH